MSGNEILQAREERWQRKLSLLSRFALGEGEAGLLSLASLTLRMPATLRLSGTYDSLALAFLSSFLRELELASITPVYEEYRISADGPEALILASAPAERLKRLSVAWEESEPTRALADLDIMDHTGRNISRSDLGYPPRACLVCGGNAAVCSADSRHAASDLESAIDTILHRSRSAAPPVTPTQIGRLAFTAALYEASAHPKPGLVDPLSQGAHADMDYLSFISSCVALEPWFAEAARLGYFHRGSQSSLFLALREKGREAEEAMFSATGGVNTHKGLVFSLGLLCAAAGRLSASSASIDAPSVCSEAACIVAGIVARDLGAASIEDAKQAGNLSAESRPTTKGARLYQEKGIRGIRGEAEDGFPSVLGIGLPALRSGLQAGLSMNDAMIDALLSLCAAVEDTAVLGRRGQEGLDLLRRKASEALALGGISKPAGKDAIEAMDRLFCLESISPGGCADLLALSVFLHLLEGSPIQNASFT
ncbi:MAG TPA: triphosphoribosyl-dephospho-CoA synthase [Rectinemataceae bacterium]